MLSITSKDIVMLNTPQFFFGQTLIKIGNDLIKILFQYFSSAVKTRKLFDIRFD